MRETLGLKVKSLRLCRVLVKAKEVELATLLVLERLSGLGLEKARQKQ